MHTYKIDPNARPDIIRANCIKLTNAGRESFFGDACIYTTATRAEIDRICGESNWLLIDSMTTNKTPIDGERAHFKIGDMVLFTFRKDAPAWDAQILSERSEHGYYKLEIDNPETGEHHEGKAHESAIHSYGHYGQQELLPDQLATVTAQRDRLREALEDLLDAHDNMSHINDYLPGEKWRILEAARSTARAALAACDMESEVSK